MSEAVEAAPAEPTPIGQLESVAEFRERRAEIEPVEAVDAPAEKVVEKPAEAVAEPDPASEAGKALAAKKGSLQARIDEMARKSGETERQYQSRVSSLEAEIAALKGKAEPAVKPTADTGGPKAVDFENYEDFVDARADYRADLRLKAEREQAEQKARGQQVASAQNRVEAAAKEAHADFDETMTAFVADGHTFSPYVADAILAHPLGHELAYALAKDPAANARINAAPNAYVAGIEVGQLLAGLKPAEAAKAAPVVSKAPAPVPVAAGSTTASGSPDPANISSVSTWNKERKKYL